MERQIGAVCRQCDTVVALAIGAFAGRERGAAAVANDRWRISGPTTLNSNEDAAARGRFTAVCPMSSTDLYRQRAIECCSLADRLADPDQRRAMRQLAICWLDLLELATEKPVPQDRASRPDIGDEPSRLSPFSEIRMKLAGLEKDAGGSPAGNASTARDGGSLLFKDRGCRDSVCQAQEGNVTTPVVASKFQSSPVP